MAHLKNILKILETRGLFSNFFLILGSKGDILLALEVEKKHFFTKFSINKYRNNILN